MLFRSRAAEAAATTPVPDVYEVSGCGQTQLLVCDHPKYPGGKYDSTRILCVDAGTLGVSARHVEVVNPPPVRNENQAPFAP